MKGMLTYLLIIHFYKESPEALINILIIGRMAVLQRHPSALNEIHCQNSLIVPEDLN